MLLAQLPGPLPKRLGEHEGTFFLTESLLVVDEPAPCGGEGVEGSTVCAVLFLSEKYLCTCVSRK